jgi:hypothetical protein
MKALVRGAIRHDLRACKELAAEVSDGAAPEEVRERIEGLKTNGPLWRLGVNCLYYCRFVGAHHSAEDVRLFPAVRESDPQLGPVVDRLEADHREVAVRLDEIEAAADALLEEDGAESRARVVRALDAITDLLLTHLSYEEESLAPAILSWADWPR